MLELIETLHDEMMDLIASSQQLMTRDQQIAEIENKVSVIVGMRRTGKTTLMLKKIQQLMASDVLEQHILYVDFEDDRLLPMNQEKLAEMIDAFYTRFPENHESTSYLLLDEIQNIEGWGKVIRRLMKTKRNKIYLTGSSAKLLSKEIATELRGRAITTEVWPLSFNEYLMAKSQEIPKRIKSKKSRDTLHNHLLNYINAGGFPETINETRVHRTIILQDYLQTVLFRDIVERHKITNISLIRYVIHYLIQNTATSLSANKLFNDLKSQGFSIGRATVYDYLSYIEDAYLIFFVPLYSESVRKTQSNPKKIYAIDTGLVNASRIKNVMNNGRYLETLVYLALRRAGHEIYYYLTEQRHEVDFFTKSLDGTLHLYQVAWSIEDQAVYEREERALIEAENELGIKGEIITADRFAEWVLG